MAVFGFLAARVLAEDFNYSIVSEPAGLINQSGALAAGATLNSPILWAEVSGNAFAYWKLNGVRQADASGQALPSLKVAVNGPLVLTAVYVQTDDDTDEDGVPDWFEWRQLGSLAQNAAADLDGDGYPVSVELRRGYSARIADTVEDGGIASRRSSTLTYVTPGYFLCEFTSEPAGLVSQTAAKAAGALTTTPAVPLEIPGWTFGYWNLYGVRQADAAGQALPQVGFTVSGPTTATAVYVNTDEDSDADGVRDWYELRQFGDLAHNAHADPDADGLAVGAEFRRGYSARIVDIVKDGGVASRRSPILTYVPPGYFLCEFTSEPAGFVSQTIAKAAGTVAATPTIVLEESGWSFAYWTLNGNPQVDSADQSSFIVEFTVAGPTTVTAVYTRTDDDVDVDGVPDWYELKHFRNLAQGANADLDGDGFAVDSEYRRGYSARIFDTVIDGSIASRLSESLAFNPAVKPFFISEPSSASVATGDLIVFSAVASGLPAPAFQWRLNGADIPGATTSIYEILSVQLFHAGAYTVVISANGLSAVSSAATLTVSVPSSSSSRLLNLSTRGLAGAGANQLFPGFVISGTGTKKLLIRAIGPSLGDLAPSLTVLPDPRMELKRFNFTTQAYEDLQNNDNWQTNANAAEITTVGAQVFAFPFTDAADAALLVDLPAGQYAVVGGDKDGTSAIGMVELYDADVGNPTATLINISNRGFAGIGEQVMIPGFVISSEGPKTLLVRVVGPTLGGFGVPGTMVDPKLEIYLAGAQTPILTNDNWGENPDAATTAQTAINVSAFALAAGSTDAAMVVTLPPGGYTVVGSSAVAGGTGVVLVEVYVVP